MFVVRALQLGMFTGLDVVCVESHLNINLCYLLFFGKKIEKKIILFSVTPLPTTFVIILFSVFLCWRSRYTYRAVSYYSNRAVFHSGRAFFTSIFPTNFQGRDTLIGQSVTLIKQSQ